MKIIKYSNNVPIGGYKASTLACLISTKNSTVAIKLAPRTITLRQPKDSIDDSVELYMSRWLDLIKNNKRS